MYSNKQYYNTYNELQKYIQEFNNNNQIELSIDTVRIVFQKQHKISKLNQFGKWHKLNKANEQIKRKLNKRLDDDEVTTVYQYENENIYYYNSNKDKPHYRKSILVIFGMKQYHKKTQPLELIKELVNFLTFGRSKNECNIDVCFDMQKKPNINNVGVFFDLHRYFDKEKKKLTDTYYINDTRVLMLDKICIYNKAIKNGLDGVLHRIEATITIPNLKALQMPLNDFKQIIEIVKGQSETIIKDEQKRVEETY